MASVGIYNMFLISGVVFFVQIELCSPRIGEKRKGGCDRYSFLLIVGQNVLVKCPNPLQTSDRKTWYFFWVEIMVFSI